MNKISKLGVSALCGSLAAISAAKAGDLSVTGGVDMSWVSLGGGTGHTGNPLGIGSNLTFKGSGELDNGWAWSWQAELDSGGEGTSGAGIDDAQVKITTDMGQ